ncbi:MAG: response regulator [Alphaproteobacteria bacterium]|nr:response regulator [Alphaproteobacteria bacterium]
MLEQLSMFLNRRVGSLYVARNGVEGLAAFGRDRPDIVITDIVMPEMDGLTMAERIKQLDPATPVIVTTAVSETDHLIRAIEIGIDKYVLKPIDTAALLEAVGRIAAGLQQQRRLTVFGKALDEVTDAVALTERTGRIVYANRAFRRAVAEDGHDVVDRQAQDLISIVEPPNLLERLWSETQRSWRGEVTVRTAGGMRYALALYNVLKDLRGSTPLGFLMLIDLTEQREAEEAVAAARADAAAAAAASAAKSRFLANISHDIRTPMTGVLGMLELVKRTELSGIQRHYIDAAAESGQSLLTILNNVLDLARIEAGRLDLRSEPLDLADLAADILRLFALPAHDKGIELVLRVAGDCPGRLLGDEGRIRQILMNLVGNALRFTETGEVELVVETAIEDDGDVRVAVGVRDTGIGIEPEAQRRIFDVFSQADEATTRRFGGTGLGLTIASELAQHMGGGITVESVPGAGSLFRAIVRLRPAPGPVDDRPADLTGRRFLVVDPNGAARRAVCERLAGAGAETIAAARLAEAAALLESGSDDAPPAAALIDVHLLKGRDGAEDAAARMAIARQAGMLVALGGFLDVDPSADDATDSAGLLVKPGSPARFLAALERMIAGRQPAADDAVGAEARLAASILLAEDDPMTAEITIGILEAAGAAVSHVANGRAAVEAWEAGTFDVVLMDCQMPEMDGFDAARQIRARETVRPAGRRTPILALTASALDEDARTCLEAGMDDRLVKPLTPDLLVMRLRRSLAGRAEPLS